MRTQQQFGALNVSTMTPSLHHCKTLSPQVHPFMAIKPILPKKGIKVPAALHLEVPLACGLMMLNPELNMDVAVCRTRIARVCMYVCTHACLHVCMYVFTDHCASDLPNVIHHDSHAR
jgi:hypothetical protein